MRRTTDSYGAAKGRVRTAEIKGGGTINFEQQQDEVVNPVVEIKQVTPQKPTKRQNQHVTAPVAAAQGKQFQSQPLSQQLNQFYLNMSRVQGRSVTKKPNGTNNKALPEINWTQISRAMPAIIKLQSLFRAKLAMRNLELRGMEEKRQLVKQKSSKDPEGDALGAFCSQLAKRLLTPEAFFRVCDATYSKSVPVTTFNENVEYFGLKLTKNQIARLGLILDEDNSGEISLKEFQSALQTYNLSGKGEIHLNKSFGKNMVPYQKEVYVQLVRRMGERLFTPSKLFEASDINRSNQISTDDLVKGITQWVWPEINLKESKVIKDAFTVQGSQNIDLQTYLTKFQQMNSQAAHVPEPLEDDDFGADDLERGDQSMAVNVPGAGQMSPRTRADQATKAVISAMERQGLHPAQVWAVADPNGLGSTKALQLLKAMMQLINGVKQATISQSVRSFGNNPSAAIDRKAFLTIYDGSFDRKVNPTKARPQTASATTPNQGNEAGDLIKKLDSVMLRTGVSPIDAFRAADKDGSGFIHVPELREALKRMLPGDKITPADLKLTMIAFDTNRNGRIEEEEFIRAFEQARKSTGAMSSTQRPQSAAMRTTHSDADCDIPVEQIIRKLDEILDKPLERALLPLLKFNTEIPQTQVKKAIKSASKQDLVSSGMLNTFINGCIPGQSYSGQKLKSRDIVNFIRSTSSTFNFQDVIKNLARQIRQPYRNTLEEEVIGLDCQFIEKDDFMESFKNFEGLNDWKILCLFYYQHQEQDVFDMEFFVDQLNIAGKVGKGASASPRRQEPAPQKKPQPVVHKVEKVAKPNKMPTKLQKGVEVALGARISRNISMAVCELPEVDESTEGSDQFLDIKKKMALELQVIIAKSRAEEEKSQSEWDYDPTKEGCLINNSHILKTMGGIYRLQKILTEPDHMKNLLVKSSKWIESFEGNDQQGVTSYFEKELTRLIMANKQELKEGNSLMTRIVFSTIKDPKTKQPLFNLFELVTIAALFADRDGFNQLDYDPEFGIAFINMPLPGDKNFPEFLQECKDRMTIRIWLATLIYEEQHRFEKAGKDLNIIDEVVWTNVRFGDLAAKFIHAIAFKNGLDVIEKCFKDSPGNDEDLSYFDFNLMVTDTLGISDIRDWMWDDFLSYLDDMALAQINLGDFVQWMEGYGFDLKIDVARNYREITYNKERAIAPEDYVITEKDYFRPGITTILNSEKAAFKKCLDLQKEVGKEGKFFDVEFGPKNANDPKGSAHSMYFKGVKPQSHVDPEDVEWLRPSEYLDNGADGKFIMGDVSANEVKQGMLGDCWFIGAMSVLSTRDELLRGGVPNVDMTNPAVIVDKHVALSMSQGVYPPIFHQFRRQKIFCLRFFKEMSWRYVIIDDRIPISKNNRKPVFASCVDNQEQWVPLVEKAYAKLFGCYETLVSGFIDDGLADMTAYVCEKRTIHDPKTQMFPIGEQPKEDLWEYLMKCKHRGCLMGCSVTGGTEKNVMLDDNFDTGILSGHAYGLNDVFEIEDPDMENPRKTHRLLRVRNPWGHTEWKGKWSDNSEEMDKHYDKLEAYVNELDEDERFELGANDGTFLINFENFRDIYNKLFACIDFPDHWWCVRFTSAWTAKNSGGLPLKRTQEAMERFADNPQYLLHSERDCELFLSLAQPDGRIVDKNGNYSRYPFQDRINTAWLGVYELKDGEERISSYRKPENLSTPKVLHEISLSMKLKAGKTYVVIPSCRNEGTTGDFHLSVYTDVPLHVIDIRRLDEPENTYDFIMEEYEKAERRVPQWKINQVRACLKDIVQSDDSVQRAATMKKSATLRKS